MIGLARAGTSGAARGCAGLGDPSRCYTELCRHIPQRCIHAYRPSRVKPVTCSAPHVHTFSNAKPLTRVQPLACLKPLTCRPSCVLLSCVYCLSRVKPLTCTNLTCTASHVSCAHPVTCTTNHVFRSSTASYVYSLSRVQPVTCIACHVYTLPCAQLFSCATSHVHSLSRIQPFMCKPVT